MTSGIYGIVEGVGRLPLTSSGVIERGIQGIAGRLASSDLGELGCLFERTCTICSVLCWEIVSPNGEIVSIQLHILFSTNGRVRLCLDQ